MPLLKPRAGANDGGYAVADYRAVDPRVGTMDDLEQLATELRGRDMSLCVDLVLNHTAREHPWARAWLAGDPEYADFYYAYPDRTMPDAYEATVNDVFPEQAPGSFTWIPEADAWVWTTFFPYQWDLNWNNPRVFAAVLETILWLANRGIDLPPGRCAVHGQAAGRRAYVARGHDIVQALHAMPKIAAPAVVFKTEAIAPDDLVAYLGGHTATPRASWLYSQLMVVLSEPRDEGRASPSSHCGSCAPSRPRRPGRPTSLLTTWAVGDVDAHAVGDPSAHRDFLNAFYSGRFPLSAARGAV